MRTRIYAYALSLLVGGLVASPLFGAFANDDFPISTYPMFASPRSTLVSVPSVVRVDAEGAIAPVPPTAIANDEVIQAAVTIRHAIRQGPEATAALCERVADGLAGSNAVEVRVQTARYDALEYFAESKEPQDVAVHQRCEVPR